MKQFIINNFKVILSSFVVVEAFAIILLIIYSVVLGISYSNIIDQSEATIDYVYSTETGADPSYSDTWLGEQYCSNELALNLSYPEKQDECAEIMSNSID